MGNANDALLRHSTSNSTALAHRGDGGLRGGHTLCGDDMSKPIKVGDLVMVVRPTLCCKNPHVIGMIFRVMKLGDGLSQCDHCKRYQKNDIYALRPDAAWIQLSRIIRIDPPAQNEETRTDQEIAA